MFSQVAAATQLETNLKNKTPQQTKRVEFENPTTPKLTSEDNNNNNQRQAITRSQYQKLTAVAKTKQQLQHQPNDPRNSASRSSANSCKREVNVSGDARRLAAASFECSANAHCAVSFCCGKQPAATFRSGSNNSKQTQATKTFASNKDKTDAKQLASERLSHKQNNSGRNKKQQVDQQQQQKSFKCKRNNLLGFISKLSNIIEIAKRQVSPRKFTHFTIHKSSGKIAQHSSAASVAPGAGQTLGGGVAHTHRAQMENAGDEQVQATAGDTCGESRQPKGGVAGAIGRAFGRAPAPGEGRGSGRISSTGSWRQLIPPLWPFNTSSSLTAAASGSQTQSSSRAAESQGKEQTNISSISSAADESSNAARSNAQPQTKVTTPPPNKPLPKKSRPFRFRLSPTLGDGSKQQQQQQQQQDPSKNKAGTSVSTNNCRQQHQQDYYHKNCQDPHSSSDQGSLSADSLNGRQLLDNGRTQSQSTRDVCCSASIQSAPVSIVISSSDSSNESCASFSVYTTAGSNQRSQPQFPSSAQVFGCKNQHHQEQQLSEQNKNNNKRKLLGSAMNLLPITNKFHNSASLSNLWAPHQSQQDTTDGAPNYLPHAHFDASEDQDNKHQPEQHSPSSTSATQNLANKAASVKAKLSTSASSSGLSVARATLKISKSLLNVEFASKQHNNSQHKQQHQCQLKPPQDSAKKNSLRDKRRKQKGTGKMDKLRQLVTYLHSTPQCAVDLEADELELAHRYKRNLVLCEECLQTLELQAGGGDGRQHASQSQLGGDLGATTASRPLSKSPDANSTSTSNQLNTIAGIVINVRRSSDCNMPGSGSASQASLTSSVQQQQQCRNNQQTPTTAPVYNAGSSRPSAMFSIGCATSIASDFNGLEQHHHHHHNQQQQCKLASSASSPTFDLDTQQGQICYMCNRPLDRTAPVTVPTHLVATPTCNPSRSDANAGDCLENSNSTIGNICDGSSSNIYAAGGAASSSGANCSATTSGTNGDLTESVMSSCKSMPGDNRFLRQHRLLRHSVSTPGNQHQFAGCCNYPLSDCYYLAHNHNLYQGGYPTPLVETPCSQTLSGSGKFTPVRLNSRDQQREHPKLFYVCDPSPRHQQHQPQSDQRKNSGSSTSSGPPASASGISTNGASIQQQCNQNSQFCTDQPNFGQTGAGIISQEQMRLSNKCAPSVKSWGSELHLRTSETSSVDCNQSNPQLSTFCEGKLRLCQSLSSIEDLQSSQNHQQHKLKLLLRHRNDYYTHNYHHHHSSNQYPTLAPISSHLFAMNNNRQTTTPNKNKSDSNNNDQQSQNTTQSSIHSLPDAKLQVEQTNNETDNNNQGQLGVPRNSSSCSSSSAWANPRGLASWIDQEINTLVSDLESNTAFVKTKSKKSKDSRK